MGMTGTNTMQQRRWRHWTAQMLWPVLLLFAMVPRGFMPDMAGMGRGDLSLTLCRVVQSTPDGPATQAVDHGLACPFGFLPMPLVPVAFAGAVHSLYWRLLSLAPSVGWVGIGASPVHGVGARGPPGA